MILRKLLFLFMLLPITGFSQILEKSHWKYHLEPENPKKGDEVELVFDVKIDEDWYLYSSDFDPDLGPMLTEFEYEKNNTFELIGEVVPVNPKEKYDDLWEGNYTYFTKKAQFRQKIRILSENYKITGEYSFQVCSDVDGKCIPGDGEIKVVSASVKDGKESVNLDQNEPKRNQEEGNNLPIWLLIITGLIGGLAAVATPCIYPLIPITISIFLKQSTTKREGVTKALVYGVSIIIFFLSLGFIVSYFWGAAALNELSTHWLFNVILFILFFVFALSFFGLFEIQLPNSMVTVIDKQADKGGYIGIFFMAITLVVVSFSCTAPIVSTVLIKAVSGTGNEISNGLFTMLGFSLAFAIPFTGFALFPGVLKALPKSGGWLNTVKVTLGFLELALAMKFLSVADLAYHWGILDRDVFLAIWIVIFTLLGFYLLGKIKLSKDSEMSHLPILRMIVAILTFSFVAYLIPGLWGAPLKPLSGYLPPLHTLDFRPSNSGGGIAKADPICETPRFSNILHAPDGIPAYFDFDQALNCAKASGKPLFIDFTGHGCVNCRDMEARVWSDPQVMERLQNDFVVVELYVDDRTVLPESEWVKSTYDNKLKKTIGKKNADFQITQYNNNAQPFYVILGHDDKNPLVKPRAYDTNIANFVAFLEEAKEAFYK